MPARARFLAALLLAFLLIPLPLGAGEPPPPGGSQDWITGGFENTFCQYGIDAHSGPNGEKPGGFVSATCFGGGMFARGPVVCADVVGNRGGLVWQLRDTNFLQEGFFQYFSVIDNGPPGSLLPDMTGSPPDTPEPPPACPPSPAMSSQVLQGNIVVHDSA